MSKVIYWRQELPPLSELIEGEHEIEAESPHVHYNLYDRSAMWTDCYRELAEVTEDRVRQEVERLGGSCAHILDEEVTGRTDDAAAMFWLRGRFRFLMYRHPVNDSAVVE
jgi:hypothetical protein